MNVPQLRFDGFDGLWKEIKLGEFVEFKNGLNYLKSDRGETVYTVGVKNFNQKKLKSTLKLETINLSSIPNKDFLLKKNDLLFVRSNGNKELVGRMMLIETELTNTYYSGFVIRGRIKERENLEPLFLLSLESKIKDAMKTLTGGTNISNLNQSILNSLALNVPSMGEQKKIASFITLIEQKIEKQQEKIEKLEQFKKGMMQKIFSQELRFKDEDGEEFPEWKETTFGKVVTNKSEKHNPKSETILLPCIELENIEQGSGQLIGNINNSDQQSMKNKFDKGSVLFGKLRPYLKKYLYTNFEGLCSTEIWVLNSKDSILTNGFIYFFIQGAEFLEAANKSIGSKMPRADWNSVSELQFNIPSKKEQEKIVDFLKALENKIVTEEEKLMVLEEQKKGFMQGMFV